MRADSAISTDPHNPVDQREAERLAALERYDILDTPREEIFDRIARLIRNVLGVEVAIISLIDAHRQWYKAVEGLDNREVGINDTFCRYTMQQDHPLVVSDARDDDRFSAHPMVTGAPHIRSYASVALRTPQGHKLGTVCAIDFTPRKFSTKEVEILRDLAQIAMDEMELRSLAATDALTGLPSRRAFKEAAARAVALARRHKHDLTCIAFDLDHFKAINDTYGHASGDAVLQAMADACRRTLRKTDIVGRVGGEEFAIVMPHTDMRGAADVAEKLRAGIEAMRFNFGNVNVGITASLGLAQLQGAGNDVDTLLAEADVALYEAKAAGRNRCITRKTVEEIRKSVRRRVLKAGRILLNNRHSLIDCTVRSLSEDGAGIDVVSTSGIPERFLLSIPSDRLEAACRIVSQTDKHIEVEFG